jgi:hypothetical protein
MEDLGERLKATGLNVFIINSPSVIDPAEILGGYIVIKDHDLAVSIGFRDNKIVSVEEQRWGE